MMLRSIVLFLSLFLVVGCIDIRNQLVEWFTPTYEAQPAHAAVTVNLMPVFEGYPSITEIVFLPGSNDQFLGLQKGGVLRWFDLRSKKSGELLRLKVLTASEQGLLGFAFSPTYRSDGLVYIHYSVDVNGKKIGRISQWKASHPENIMLSRFSNERILIEVEQPYANHNGGHIEFGADGYLYIGFGDGGWRDDPHKNGQNPKTLLGTMLRIDPQNKKNSKANQSKPYSIPADNPRLGWLPEIYAIGLRNPWKFSFAPDGRLIVADVGQDTYEEISIVEKGKNYGWNIREGFHCFDPPENCSTAGLVDPVYEYTHDEGKSITGGYVYNGSLIPSLKGYYVFGDFVGGWIKAIRLPADGRQRVTESVDLGRWPILISTFGRSASGELYVADFGKGTIYQIIAQ